jgi:hypothetical protein
MANNLKFPGPNDYPAKSPAVLCPSERVLNLYNQDSGHRADRVAQKVKIWFSQEAHVKGWAGVRFLPEVQIRHMAGAILWQPHRVQIALVTKAGVLPARR